MVSLSSGMFEARKVNYIQLFIDMEMKLNEYEALGSLREQCVKAENGLSLIQEVMKFMELQGGVNLPAEVKSPFGLQSRSLFVVTQMRTIPVLENMLVLKSNVIRLQMMPTR